MADQRHVAYILAAPMTETGGSFIPGVEGLSCSTAALKSKFSIRISVADADRYGRTAEHAANQPEIANRTYGGDWGRIHLGNTASTDGWTWGRGLCQITGRANYAKSGVVSDPDRAARLPTAAAIMGGACWMDCSPARRSATSSHRAGPTGSTLAASSMASIEPMILHAPVA